ncbi:MAG: thermonuclease family protein [Methanothrix sp.]|jgi:micrococcal nuclease|nr:thermonuclease family protein [Methanothrix sp.]
MRRWILLFVALALLLPPVPALFDEAKGIVTYVTDGDTITVEGVGVVRLADVDSPELAETGGPEAKEYTRKQLLGKLVFLDLDNITGLDRYGRKVCIVSMVNDDGSVGENFNCMLVDAGHATVEDVKDNEFDPREWWETTGLNTDPIADKKFVGSTESDKYHYPECRWAKKISPNNEIWFSSSDDAKSNGYVPCKVCHPT